MNPKRLFELPFVGAFIKFMNAYAYKGDSAYRNSWAPIELWKLRVFPAHIRAIMFTIFIMILVYILSPEDFDPGSYILGAVPDLLGFAMGTFAIIFVLPSEFINKLKENEKIKIEEFPINIAYPLLGLVMCLFFSFITEIFGDDNFYIQSVETYLVLYAIEMIIDLVTFISTLGRASLSKYNT